jgi:hypothetical protein
MIAPRHNEHAPAPTQEKAMTSSDQPTSTRVSVTLTFATSEVGGEILQAVLRSLADADGYLTRTLESTSVHTFDLDAEPTPEPAVQLVVPEGGAFAGIYINDLEQADRTAEQIGGVVVELPIIADHRPTDPTGQAAQAGREG